MNQPYDSPSRLGRSPRPGAGLGSAATTGPLGRVLGVIAGTVLAVCALFVSVVAFAAVLVVGAVAGGWLWWKTRDVRRQLRAEMARMQESLQRGTPFGPGSPFDQAARGNRTGDGEVIEGDFIREAPPGRRQGGDDAGSSPRG